jgi:hypothetical protein
LSETSSSSSRLSSRILQMEPFDRCGSIRSHIEEYSDAIKRTAGAVQASEAKKMPPDKDDANQRYVGMNKPNFGREAALAAMREAAAAADRAWEELAEVEVLFQAKRQAALLALEKAAAAADHLAECDARSRSAAAVRPASPAKCKAPPAKAKASRTRALPAPVKPQPRALPALVKPQAPPAKAKAPQTRALPAPVKPQPRAIPVLVKLKARALPAPVKPQTLQAKPVKKTHLTTWAAAPTPMETAAAAKKAKFDERHNRTAAALKKVKEDRAKKVEEKLREAKFVRNPWGVAAWAPPMTGKPLYQYGRTKKDW